MILWMLRCNHGVLIPAVLGLHSIHIGICSHLEGPNLRVKQFGRYDLIGILCDHFRSHKPSATAELAVPSFLLELKPEITLRPLTLATGPLLHKQLEFGAVAMCRSSSSSYFRWRLCTLEGPCKASRMSWYPEYIDPLSPSYCRS